MIIIVWMILQRVAKSETATGTAADLESDRKDEDFNWKVIRVEVFRCPSHRYTLCAFVGSGTQLVLMVIQLFETHLFILLLRFLFSSFLVLLVCIMNTEAP